MLRYLSEEEVLDTRNPFVQLLSGVVWLIRNGSIYVNESLSAECDETQETGSFNKFVNVISARTAVGHDREGQVVLFHADGQTGLRGINLWEMAEFLLQQGVVNAINLDGGGSATFILNGTLASYPSDHCQDNNMWRCPRRVSTVVCVHEPHCQPPDCNGHGLCTSAGCHCSAGWTGSNCSEGKQNFMPPGVAPGAQGHWLFTGATGLGLTLGLLLLLLLSVALNVALLRRPRAQRDRNRNLEGDYAYQPLCALNSDLLPTRRGSWETATIPLRTGDPSCP
ncbi:N-acetylglucosamine-1-phosphodiester alpha-N-acetylglucosaminidase [Echinops telfairi]|uniref:N-acetylglucosamine-1-phosphodiester alpha-N-acetylglucosaminidase n=1 Tax=Echinops telfairi TaxID=9371 RepID=A0AC55CRL5_ECHTE|nr:N-acetylglucosamine-1-phosphodiester alpha-N-acetylglucosaminidase [Echinops telfairi]